jgi:GNAT superfamily N-acetyltransferase
MTVLDPVPPMHRIAVVRGADITPYLDDVARLRIAVFAHWPYLYVGDVDYERDYLAAYARSARSVFVLALDGKVVVGASTGLPLLDDTEAFSAPLAEAGLDATKVFYFGESVLLPAWRGRGIGHAFFDARQAHARALGGFETTAFCVVDRAPDDPRRPADHRDHDAFWHKRGYTRRAGLAVTLPWKEPGLGELSHSMTFWTRPLEPSA